MKHDNLNNTALFVLDMLRKGLANILVKTISKMARTAVCPYSDNSITSEGNVLEKDVLLNFKWAKTSKLVQGSQNGYL